jgi:reverse gyrase
MFAVAPVSMYEIGPCYNCGHHVVFARGQKSVLCRRCLKRLNCAKVDVRTAVNSLLQASKVIKALESDGKVIGFGEFHG